MTSLTRLLSHTLIVTMAILYQTIAVNAQSLDAKTKGTGSITGRVTIGDKPAPGILVTVNSSNLQASAGQATSDADGHYRISGLNAGQFTVMPVAPTYVLPATNPMFGQGKSISLSSGEAIDGVDFKITKGSVITGRVTDADGRPVIEERITLLPSDENGAPMRQQFSRISNYQMYQTDDRGVYRIFGLPAGHYKISAGDEPGRISGLRAAGFYQKTYYPDATDISRASMVDLSEGGEAKNINISLGRRAATYTVSGRIVDADTGAPLPGIQYSFGVIQSGPNQSQSYVAGSASPGTPTNSQGEFRLEGIEPGHYAVFVSRSRFGLESTAAPKVYSDPAPFDVIDGDVTNLDIKAQRGLSLSGVVVMEGITDKNVLTRLSRLRINGILSQGTNGGIQAFMGNGESATVNPDGSFQIEDLHPGRVSLELGALSAVDSRGLSITRIEREGVLQNRQIEIQPGHDVSGVRIYLAYGTGVIRGQVKIEGGTLPSDAVILVGLMHEGMESRFFGEADLRGRFLLEHIPAGTYEVTMQIYSFGSQNPPPRGFPGVQRQTVSVANDTESEVLFTLDLAPKEGP